MRQSAANDGVVFIQAKFQCFAIEDFLFHIVVNQALQLLLRCGSLPSRQPGNRDPLNNFRSDFDALRVLIKG